MRRGLGALVAACLVVAVGLAAPASANQVNASGCWKIAAKPKKDKYRLKLNVTLGKPTSKKVTTMIPGRKNGWRATAQRRSSTKYRARYRIDRSDYKQIKQQQDVLVIPFRAFAGKVKPKGNKQNEARRC